MFIKSFFTAVVGFIFVTNMAFAQEPALKDRVGGVGLNVSDIERSLDYYTRVLGMKVLVKVPNKDGGLLEVAMNLSGSFNDAMVVIASGLATEHGAKGGDNSGFGRVIFNVVDGQVFADRISAAGFEVNKLDFGGSAGPNVFMAKDPDGYMLEFFEFPKEGAKLDFMPE